MILVTPLSGIEGSIARYRPSHLVTLLSPDHMISTPEGVAPDNHLRLPLDDVSEAWVSACAPCADDVGRLLRFGRSWNGDAPMIVHCWAGVSRSTAAAYALLCDRLRPGSELAIAQALRRRAPHANPNPLIVRLADEALGRGGRMIAAIESIGRGEIVAEGACVELPVLLDDLTSCLA